MGNLFDSDAGRERTTRLPYYPTKADTGYGVADAAIQKILRDARDGKQYVDILLFSDSNANFGNYGWVAGMMQGSHDAGIPLYGTPVMTNNERGGGGRNFGEMVKSLGGGAIGTTSGAPAFAAENFLELQYLDYLYLAEGSLPSKTFMYVLPNFPGGHAHTWNFRQHYAKFAEGGAPFQLRCRLEQSPGTLLASASLTSEGDYDHLTYADLVADASSANVLIGFGCNSGGNAKQFFSYVLGWRTDLTGGICINMPGFYGGEKLTDFVYTHLPTQTDKQLRGYFDVIRQKHLSLNQQPRLVMCLNMGMNDRTVTSVATYKAAMVSFMDRIRTAYFSIGGMESELFFLLMPSHRISDDPYDTQQNTLNAYSNAADDLALVWSNTASINLQNLFTRAEGVARGWYDSGGPYHLLFEGTTELWKRALNRVFGI